jgi:hypothetical protein
MRPPSGVPADLAGGGRADAPRSVEPGPTAQGVRAALTLFAGVAAMHLLTFALVKIAGGTDAWGYFLLEGPLVLVVILVAFVLLMIRLPKRAREPFILTTLLCGFATTILWGVTCAAAM